jgi:methionyl-tRNA formyltransferase
MYEFGINNLKSVVILGANPKMTEIKRIVESLNLSFTIITSPGQENTFNKHFSPVVFEELNEKFISFMKDKFVVKETLFISLASRWIFKKNIIEGLFNNQLVNFHNSRLPVDAGGGIFSWRIMRCDRIDSQLVHLVDEGIDSGDIIDYKMSILPKECKIPSDFEAYYHKNFLLFFKEFCQSIKKGNRYRLKPQQKYLSTYLPRLSTLNNSYIDWSLSSDKLVRFIDAFDEPYPGAQTFINNQEVHIKNVQLHGGEINGHPFMRGLVIRCEDGWILVMTSEEYCLIIEKVISKDGVNILSNIKVGDRFYTPNDVLDQAIKHRPRFGPKTMNKY